MAEKYSTVFKQSLLPDASDYQLAVWNHLVGPNIHIVAEIKRRQGRDMEWRLPALEDQVIADLDMLKKKKK